MEALKEELQGENAAAAQALLDQLTALKSTIEADLQAIEEEITALKAKDAALEEQIASLKSYVDGQLAALEKEMGEGFATEAWAKASFATLAQYDSLQTVVSGIKASIEGLNTAIETLETRVNNKIATDIAAAVDSLGTALTGDYTSKIGTAVSELTAAYTTAIGTAKSEMETAYIKAIGEAIATSEESMKAWVADTLAQDYYDIATIDALLGVLTTKVDSVDTALSDSIAAQKSALATAKSELTAAYQQAIAEAINNNNGVIDTKIANAIATAKAELQNQIDAINTEINTIKGRLTALEGKVDALIARIQSIRFMPEYSDGMVELTSDNAPVTLTFLLSPKAAAQAVAAAYANDNSVVAAYLSRTQSRTRAVDAPTAINVTKVTGTADGMLTIEVNTENLPADYWADAENANLFIRISDGNNDVISEMIPTFYTVICNLPKGAIFLGAILKELPDDKSVKAIKFVAGSSADDMNAASAFTHSYYKMPANAKYKIIDATATTPKTLIICTDAEEFIFNADCYNMFNGNISVGNELSEITTIDFGNCINTSNVTSMSYMFTACRKLTSLDLSSFNTANVTNMSYMFHYCTALTSLDLSSFNTANVTNMRSMFYNCTALTELDLSSFNTEKVTNMSNMFYSCSALTSLDLSRFNTANVTTMKCMFQYCRALKILDIQNFDIGSVTDFTDIFASVGLTLFENETQKAKIKVTTALKTALESKSVSPGNFAEYYVTDAQPM